MISVPSAFHHLVQEEQRNYESCTDRLNAIESREEAEEVSRGHVHRCRAYRDKNSLSDTARGFLHRRNTSVGNFQRIV